MHLTDLLYNVKSKSHAAAGVSLVAANEGLHIVRDRMGELFAQIFNGNAVRVAYKRGFFIVGVF